MKKNVNILLFVIALSSHLFPQNVTEMEFRNQPLKDILLVLAQVSHQSIIPDETIDGNGTYVFYDMPFEEALSRFLDNFGLYANRENGVYHISRVGVEYDSSSKKISLWTEGERISVVLQKISKVIGKTILYDSLPNDSISLNFNEGEPGSLLETIIRKYPEYSLEETGDYFYISRHVVDRSGIRNYGGSYFEYGDGLYSADLKQVRFIDVLADLMGRENLEFSLMGRNDSVLERFSFRDKDFSRMLDLLAEQGQAGYTIIGDIYYFYDRDRQDILNRYNSSIRIALEHHSADSVLALIPASYSRNIDIKKDASSNCLILTGALEPVGFLEKYIEELDRGFSGYSWHRFDPVYLDSVKINPLLPPEYKGMSQIVLPEGNAFLVFTDDKTAADLNMYLRLIDRQEQSYPIYLDYISGEEFLENLPPFVSEDEITLSKSEDLVYFTGEGDKLKKIEESLRAIDRPRPQLRYEILVIQVRDVDQLDWDFSLSSEIQTEGTQTALTGSLGNVMNLNFDLVSQFGYLFAAKLNVALNESNARIMADTTLFGLSGEEIQFQNTGTSRYYALTYDSQGDVQDEKTIKEISSGILLNIQGWVSGDGMITMDISSTISKQNTAASSDSGALPTTTEKVISTHVRTPSGKPIIITGLKQQDRVVSLSKVPFLGDIPLLGLLFQSRQEEMEDTDFYVTIVPYLESFDNEPETGFYEEAFLRLVEGYDR